MSILSVCLVSPLPPPYGGIAHWCGLITKFAEHRPEVEVIVVNTTPSWRSRHELGVFKRMIGGGVQMFRDLFRLFRILRRGKIRVIHLTTSGQLAVVRDVGVLLLSKSFKVPLVYHIRFGRIPEIAKLRSIEWRLMKRVIRHAATVVSIDRLTYATLNDTIPAANVVLVPNCIDFSHLPSTTKSSEGENVALFAGWVVDTKGIRELLLAWREVGPIGWKLSIAGPGDPEYINALANEFSDCRIEFLGELSHEAAMSLMSQSDVFIQPSYTEGFPNAVLEAMAFGKAIIATSVGAIPEMLDCGECGFLIPPRDAKSLAGTLRNVLSDTSLRRAVGQKAQRRARRLYSVDTVFESYMSIWQSVVADVH